MEILDNLLNIFLSSRSISTDSRKVEKGDIFFAISGVNFDGNRFVEDALKRGAVHVIAQDSKFSDWENVTVVDDVVKTLGLLANRYRKTLSIPFVAITGTNGKTTTKELLYSVLSNRYITAATEGNFNNHIGVPLTILSIKDSAELAIIEMGANHPKEIEYLCSIAEPDFGIITNVGKAHLEGFGSFEKIIETKTELYRSIRSRGGELFVNSDNNYLLKELLDSDKVSFYNCSGVSNRGVFSGVESSLPNLTVKTKFSKGYRYIRSKLVGDYNCENIAAAVAIGIRFGLADDMIVRGVEDYSPSNNRSQYLKSDKNELILDAYNANPTSMKASVDSFISRDSSGKTLILGDMLELGCYSDQEHKALLEHIINNNHSQIKIITVGKEFSKISIEEVRSFRDVVDLIEHLKSNPIDNSMILIKGSRGVHLEDIIPFL